uniref:Uncharacterized protein n=1 Tax=Anguilla anguilla TaxID=7936 RepID=A0A0E9X924_ANGAN
MPEVWWKNKVFIFKQFSENTFPMAQRNESCDHRLLPPMRFSRVYKIKDDFPISATKTDFIWSSHNHFSKNPKLSTWKTHSVRRLQKSADRRW